MSAFTDAVDRVRRGDDHHDVARELVSEMTLDEKLGCLDGDTPLWPGIFDMTSGGYYQHPWPAAKVPRLGIPGIDFADGPRGCVVGDATAFPVSMARGATFDPELEERIGEAIGAELRASGATYTGAVCMNLLRHPAWGRAQETYGEDPYHVGAMAVALTRGLQRHVMACMKHFALNSMENARFSVDVEVDERALHEVYLPHFRRVAEEGVASVMSAYNSVNGQFCGENETLLRGILKEEWGFDGFVLSDFTFGTHPDSAINGLDLEMPSPNVFRDLLQQVQSGAVPESVVDDAVSRMVRKKLQYDLASASPVDERVIASEAHLAIAQEASADGSVLLKNDAGALPLDETSITRIAVVGSLADTPNIGDTGSSNVRPSFVITPLQGIEEALGDRVAIDHIGKDRLDADDLALIEAADAVIVVTGLTSEDEGEGLIGGGDRVDLSLGEARAGLIRSAAAANDRTIVVLEGGGAITMGEWLPDVEALLMVWYPGQMGGHAIADLLFGAVNPSGKLPITFPTGLDQLPPFDNESPEVTYGYFHGYRYLDRNDATPEFPFGFGLSYTCLLYTSDAADDNRLV